eukprot:TRINITY_DN949_c0_g1_i1.p1 TRINITY_DN949_c0_g1~~TRINITY_DN949_c0_g1_i1.p1  ORF type:complete len:416 (-),score=126.64 TRINITY_DN949_c0_g1_i1:66-1313(-)
MSESKELFCTSCEIRIGSKEEYKKHFQSDFHKYNCKRKLVSLNPVSLQDFEEKRAQLLSSAASETSEETNFVCEACGKTFAHNSQYRQHLQSRKHSKSLSKAESAAKPTDKKYAEGKPKTTLDSAGICLFCSAVSKSLDENMEHMYERHSFVLPYSDILKDKEAVIRYLAEKIHIGNICIGCNNYKTGTFKNSQAVQQHMQDKGHTYLELNIFQEEYATFVKHRHQFLKKRQPITSRISAVMTLKEIEEMKNEGEAEESEQPAEVRDESKSFSCVSLADSRDVVSVHSSAPPESEEEWEDIQLNDVKDGVKESDDQGKSTGLRKSTSLSASDLSVSSEVTIADEHILLDTGELLLSNGKLIGHRMYNYIYKQKLRSHEDRQSAAITQKHLETLKARQREMKGQGRAVNQPARFNI